MEPLVIEIGPGRGSLTECLLSRAGRLIAIEIDARLAARLGQRFRAEPRVEIVRADVLETDLARWGPAVVAGNLPYYITSPILEKLLGLGPLLRRAVLLVQKEVAERLVARAGTREYGFLTVQTQVFAAPEMLFKVPPGAFSPPPRVDSALVRLTPRPPGEFATAEERDRFLRFAGHAFRHKRKTLRNNLAGLYGKQVGEWPEAGLRAEQLSIERLIELYRRTAP